MYNEHILREGVSMAGRYHIGNKGEVLRRMAQFAIRDQESLIEALTPSFGDPDESTTAAIQDAKACIGDFRRIAAGQRGCQMGTLARLTRET
jgi:hypothetical protein